MTPTFLACLTGDGSAVLRMGVLERTGSVEQTLCVVADS